MKSNTRRAKSIIAVIFMVALMLLANFNHTNLQASEVTPVTVTATSAATSGNMVVGENPTTTVNLSSDVFTVSVVKGTASTIVGLYSDFRLYGDRATGDGNELIISVKADYQITGVKIAFGASTNSATTRVTLGAAVNNLTVAESLNSTSTFADLEITSFGIKNTGIGASSNPQVRILSIEITYITKPVEPTPELEPFVPTGQLDELEGSYLLIGDYLFDLAEGTFNLKSFLRASQTAYLNLATGEYEMYFKIGTRWYNLASDNPYAQSFSPEQINGGQGYKYFDGVHISEFQLITNKTQKLGYQDLQAAIDAANSGDLIVLNGDVEIEGTLYIDESITLDGSDYALIAKKDFGTDNSAKHSINIFADGVTIRNLVVEAADFTFGVQAYGSQNTVLTNVTINDSKGAALTVNGASVTATNLETSGSAWGAVNIDSKVSTPSAFTLVSGTLSEDLQIWSEEANAAIQATGYTEYVYENGIREFKLVPVTQAISIIRDDVNYVYSSIHNAVEAAEASETVLIQEGTYELPRQLKINEAITIKGIGEVVIKAAADFYEGTYSADKNLILVYRVTDLVVLENLTFADAKRSGVNVVESLNVQLEDVTIMNSLGAGVIVNGSVVSATNLVTSNNAWGAVNVDQGSGVTIVPIFTLLGESVLSEPKQIWAEKAVAVINAEGYDEYIFESGLRWFSTTTLDSNVYIEKDYKTYLFDTIQAAINAASEGLTVHVNEGVYVVPTGIQITKPNLTLQAHGLVEIKYSLDPLAPSPYNVAGISVMPYLGTVKVDGFTVSGFESGIVQGMAQSEGTTFIVSKNTVYPGYKNDASYMRNGIQVTGDGSQVFGNTVFGAPLTSTWAGTAIGVVNASNVIVEDNIITDSLYDIGISVMNWNSPTPMTNIMVRDNHITNAKNAFRVSGYVGSMLISGVTFEGNTVVGPETEEGVWIYALNVQTVTVDDILFIDNDVTFKNTNNLLIRLSTSSVATNVVLDEDDAKTAVVNTQNELKSLVSDDYSGDIDNIRFGSNISITSQVSVYRTVTIDGHGFALIATQDFGSVNGYKHSMTVYSDDVVIEDLTIQAALFTYGLQAFEAQNLTLNDVQITNSKGAGLTVNGSSVNAIDLVTLTNTWGAVNVDSGDGVDAISSFTLIRGTLNENGQIWSEDQNAIVIAEGYEEYVYENGIRAFTNRPFTPEISIIRGEVTYVFATLQGAVDGANQGEVILISEDITQSQTVHINKSITIDGQGHTISALSPFSTVNGYKQSINIYADNVIIKDLIIDANGYTFGLQAYVAQNVELEDVTVLESLGAGLTVNGASVTATNLITLGNAWGAVNVDSGVGVTEISSFELISGTLNENLQIWSEDHSAIVIATDFEEFVFVNEGNVRVFTDRPYSPEISIIRGDVTYVFATVQNAITGAQVDETILVKAGTYAFASKVWITKDVTILGETGVVFSSNGNDILGIQPGVELTISNVKFLGISHVGIDMAAGAILNGTNLSFEGLTTGIYVNPNGVLNVKDSSFKDLAASIGTDTKARYFTLEDNSFVNVGEVLGFTASNDTKRNFDLLAAYVVLENTGVTLEQVKSYGSFVVAINENTGIGYTTIQAAINAAQAGHVILVEPGTYTLTQQLLINKAITVKGIGEVIIEAAENFNLGTYNADKHLVSIVGVEGMVTLENLTVRNSKRTGINVFESTDVRLVDITSMNNVAAGVTVTNSKVTATNLTTSGNGWSSVNVDNGSAPGSNAPATEFILVSGSIQSAYSNSGNVSVTMPAGYYTTNYFGVPNMKHVWSPAPLVIETGAVINVSATEINVYATVQLAIAAAQDGGTIKVLPGRYTFASRVDMVKNLTIQGQAGVIFNSTNPSIFVVQSGKTLIIDEVEFTGGNVYAIELSANSTLTVTDSIFRTKYGIYVNPNGMLTVTNSVFEVTGGVAIGTDTKASTLAISGNTFAAGLGEALGFTAKNDIEANFLALEAAIIANNTGATAANINSYGTFSKDYAMVVALMASVDELDYTNASWSTYQAIVDGNSVSESSTLAQTSQAYDNIKAAQQQLVIATVFNTTRGLRYASIQVAINEALAFEVIEISEGTYDGFVVNKSNLTIQAEADKDVFITPNYFATGSVSQYMAILVSGATNVKLDGLQIVGNNEYVGLAGFNGAGVIVDNMHFENLVRGILVNTNNPGSGYISNFVITNSSFENLLVGVGGTEDSVLSASNNTFALMRSGSEGFGIGAGVTLSQTLPGLLKANTFTLTNSNYALVDYRTSPATQYGKVLYLSSASTFNSLIDATFFTEVHFTSSISSITLTRPVNIDFGNYAVNRIYILTQDTGTMTLSGTQFVNSLLEVNAPNVVINNYLAVFGTLNIIAGTFNDFS